MTAYQTPEQHDDPREARRASGIDPQGNPLYLCENCGRHAAADAFGRNEHGTLHTICRTCSERHALGVGKQRFYKDRSHITVTEKQCASCKQVKPSREFWLDGKEEDGLKKECGLCITRARKAREGVEIPAFDSYTPASHLQPVLDQAISQNEELKAELERTRAELERYRAETPAFAAAFDRELLVRFEDALRALSARLDHSRPAPAPPLLQRGLAQVARVAGPLGYRLFAWAEQHIDRDDEDAYYVTPQTREHPDEL